MRTPQYVDGTCACGHVGKQKRPDICGRCTYLENPQSRNDLLKQRMRVAAGLCRYCDEPCIPNDNLNGRSHKRPFITTCKRHTEMNRRNVRRAREKRLGIEARTVQRDMTDETRQTLVPASYPALETEIYLELEGTRSERTTEIPPPSFQSTLEENCR